VILNMQTSTSGGGGGSAVVAGVDVDPEGIGCFIYGPDGDQVSQIDIVFEDGGVDVAYLTVFVPAGESTYAEVTGPGDYQSYDVPTGDTNGDGSYDIYVLVIQYVG